MSKFLPLTLLQALNKPVKEPMVKAPGIPRPVIFQDAERIIIPGNPQAAIYDPVRRFFSLLRNRNPGGREQIQDNPGPTSGGGSLPYSLDHVIAKVPRETWLIGSGSDPADAFAGFRDVEGDRALIEQNELTSIFGLFETGDDLAGGAGIGGDTWEFPDDSDDGGDIGPGGDEPIDDEDDDDDDDGSGIDPGGGIQLCPDGSPITYFGGIGACPNLPGGGV